MNKIILLFLIAILFSCQKISKAYSVLTDKNPKNLEVIDLSQVDLFPKFKNCDAMLNFEESKLCFNTSLHKKISDKVELLKLKTDRNITDTLFIHFSIDKKGEFICNSIKLKDSLKIKLPNLSVKIQGIINDIPAVAPAQKRGIPVTSTYTIPLIIETN